MASRTCRAPTRTRLRGSSCRPAAKRRTRHPENSSRAMNAPDAQPAITTPAQHFIANRWVAPEAGATLPMIDPSTGAPFAAIAAGTRPDIDRAVAAAQRARDGAWGRLAPAEKGRAIAKV